MTIARILVGLDGSPLAESILGTVRTLAARLAAEVTLLHVVHIPEAFRASVDVTLDGRQRTVAGGCALARPMPFGSERDAAMTVEHDNHAERSELSDQASRGDRASRPRTA